MLIIKDQTLRRICKNTGFLSPIYSRRRKESRFYQRKSEKNRILAYYYAEKTQKSLSMTHEWRTSIDSWMEDEYRIWVSQGLHKNVRVYLPMSIL